MCKKSHKIITFFLRLDDNDELCNEIVTFDLRLIIKSEIVYRRPIGDFYWGFKKDKELKFAKFRSSFSLAFILALL